MASGKNFRIGINGPGRIGRSAAMVAQSQQRTDLQEMNCVRSVPVTKRGFKMPMKNLVWKNLGKFKKNAISPEAETRSNFETNLNPENLNEIGKIVMGKRAEVKQMREDSEELKTAYEDMEKEFMLAKKERERALAEVAIQSEMERILFQALFPLAPSNNDD